MTADGSSTTAERRPRILLVEDNADLAFGLRRNLEFEGYDVEVAEDGRTGLARILAGQSDLVILDLMLPELGGLEVLERMREKGMETPVLILTARGEEMDKVRGLRTGADDYVTKPFGVLELVARVEAVLRRAGLIADRTARTFTFGSVEVDTASRTVHRGGESVALAPKEYELLVALLRADGAALSRAELLRDVWGHKARVESRTVDTHIAELRRKLEPDSPSPRHIRTVRKYGYRLER